MLWFGNARLWFPRDKQFVGATTTESIQITNCQRILSASTQHKDCFLALDLVEVEPRIGAGHQGSDAGRHEVKTGH
ncbi:hypothetical protein N9B38_01680 [bacterium]|nr:hypothetical protein [bacterium]